MTTENNRLHYWAALTAFSCVSIASQTFLFTRNHSNWDGKMQWTISVATISASVAALSFFMRLFMAESFSAKYIEHGMIGVALVFWCAGLPAISEESTYLGVDSDFGLHNANLFFSSWFSFIFSLILAVDVLLPIMGDRGTKMTNLWVYFGTASFIVLTNSVTYWRDYCAFNNTEVCERDLFAMILAIISAACALAIFALKGVAMAEHCVIIILCAAWCFAVGYVTYNTGPAQRVGIYYFSVWTAFSLSLWMSVHAVIAFTNRARGIETSEDVATTEGKENGGQEVTAKQDEDEVAAGGDV